MKIAVKDANVFIDMESMGIIDLWLLLGIETLTSTFVVDELRAGDHQSALGYIDSGQIQAVNLELTDLLPLHTEYAKNGISLTDVSVIYLADKHNAVLLTGDKALRITAQIQQIECHGTIWILDQLVKQSVLHGEIASKKLTMLLELTGTRQRFLPHKLCEKYISRWQKKD